MAESNVASLLVTITALMGGAGSLAIAIAKLVRWWNQGRVQRVDHASRWEIESFQANIKALQEENHRCWEVSDRMREEHRVEVEEKNKELEQCEVRLTERRNQVHTLNNHLQVAQMLIHEYESLHGRIDLDPPNENGEPK